MPLGTEVDLSPGHIVLDGDPQRGTAAIFGAYLLWPNGWMDQDATWQGGRPQPRIVLDGDPAAPSPEWGTAAPFFGPCLLWLNGRPSHLLLSTCLLISAKIMGVSRNLV